MEKVEQEELSHIFKHSVANVAMQLYNITLKEVKKNIVSDGQDYQSGYKQGFADGKQEVLKNFPMWKVQPKDDYCTETCFARAGEFGKRVIYRGQLIKAGWWYIPYSALKMLPVELEEANEEV